SKKIGLLFHVEPGDFQQNQRTVRWLRHWHARLRAVSLERLAKEWRHRDEHPVCRRRCPHQQEVVMSLADGVPLGAEMRREENRPLMRNDAYARTERRPGMPTGKHMQRN